MSVQERLRLLKAQLKSATYAYEAAYADSQKMENEFVAWQEQCARKGLSTKASLEKRDDIFKR